MPRENKFTLDWFPHYVGASASNTVHLLETNFGPTGYMFWFKLLEKLCMSDGLFLDLSKPDQMLIMSGYVKMGSDEIYKALDMLATIRTIDPTFWQGKKIVWCPQLLEYPEIQSKLKRRRMKILSPGEVAPWEEYESKKTEKNHERAETEFGEVELDPVVLSIQQDITNLTSYQWNTELPALREEFGDDLIIYAINQAVSYGKRYWAYVVKILKTFRDKNIKSIGEARAMEDERTKQKQEGGEPVRFVT